MGGGLALLVAAALCDDYLRDLLLGFGTTLFLFAFVYIAERRLLEAVEQNLGPRTLVEAQRELTDILRSARQRGAGDAAAAVDDARFAAVRSIASQLTEAGLRQQPTTPRDCCVVFADEAGVGVHWRVSWDDGVLCQVVEVDSPTADGERLRLRSTPCELSDDGLTAEDQRRLTEFESDVFMHLREIVQRLSKPA